jgi:energy-coupling factor transport system ATP-binding protein
MGSEEARPDGAGLVASPRRQEMIQVRDLHFSYEDGTPVLRNIDLEIPDGTYVGIVGSNGSGKSTLTKHFNALLLPQGGEVLVDGESTRKFPEKARSRVGMVLQNPDNQIVGTVVEDDVAFGPENLCLPHEEIGVRVGEALERVGLAACRTRGAETLSGGQKQRLAIAGILAMRPRHVVVDEPTSMLDPVGREEVQECLRGLNADGVTIIHVTHLLEELLDADRILALEQGKVVFDGPPRELFRSPKLMERLKLELPVPASLGMALERQKGVPRKIPWKIQELLEHLPDFSDSPVEKPRDPTEVSREDTFEGEDVIRATGVTQDYLKGSPLYVRALEEVDFALRSGELVGLVGSTGSGKSTLIQVLAGLVEPTEGAVVYREGVDSKALYKSVGVVFQQPEDQLFEHTVFDDVAYGPRQMGLSEEEVGEVVPWALDLLGLPTQAILQRSPFELSGGEKRRVAIAGILSMKPELLILDEPTAGLDAEARRLLLDRLQLLHASGESTILMVSHNMELLSSLATRMVLLSGGRIVADAPPRVVFSQGHDVGDGGLRPPYPVQVVRGLKARGWDLPGGLFLVEEVAAAIGEVCRGRKRKKRR